MSTTITKSYGCIWKEGEALLTTEKDGSKSLLICWKEREFGPKGGLRAPAMLATIEEPSLKEINRGLVALGFNRLRTTKEGG